MRTDRYLKLKSLEKNGDRFKGLTFEGRSFECFSLDGRTSFLVSNKEILWLELDKDLTNWINYKDLAAQHGLALDDSEVAITSQPEETEIQAEVLETKAEAKPKAKATRSRAKASAKKE